MDHAAIVENLKYDCEKLYEPENPPKEDGHKNILAVIPNLTINGAQTVFHELMQLIKKEMKCVFFIIAPADGEYAKIYAEEGDVVCVRKFTVADETMRKNLQTSFDAVLLNTALVYSYAFFFINLKLPVFWWIHESEEHLRACCPDFPNPNLLSPNFHIYGVTEKVDKSFVSIYGYGTDILHMPIEDKSALYQAAPQDKVTFVIPAAYIPLKGQDILLSAIAALPRDYQDRARFCFCGYQVEDMEEYYLGIKRIMDKIPCVEELGKLSREETYQLYADCDCVVAPSRIDSTPTTIVEGMMFGKLTLASKNCGITKFMQDCVNGFVYETEEELRQRLLLIISDCESLRAIGEAGKEVWRKEFSPWAVIGVLKASGLFEI